jgi:trigger factor
MTLMQSEIADVGACRRRVNVTVTAEEVAREFDETLRRYARSIRIPGFRKGKVPAPIVKKRFAQEIHAEVREHLVAHGLREALTTHEVRPLHDPVVDGGELKEGEAYGFSALFEVRPRIDLRDYKGLAVSLPAAVVSDEEVDHAVDAIREKLGRFIPAEPRPVTKGDFALVDLEGRYEDGKGKDFKHEGVMIEVGSDHNLPEFEQAMPGMLVGDSKTFDVSYPAEFDAEHLSGRRVHYTVVLKEVKVKELPPADDELPKDLGRQGTLATLKEEIRADLLEGKKRQNERQAREQLLRRMIEMHPVDLPEVMVHEQVNNQLEEIARGMIVRGIHPSKAEIDWDALREKELPLARQRVLGTLILDEISVKEGISVTDGEITQRIREETEGRGERGGEIAKRLSEGGARQALKNQLVREKSLDFLLKNATITS